jgi:hypothetical protein
MEILLLAAVMAVGASALYVAATFNKRTRQNTAPLVDDAAEKISKQVKVIGEDLWRQISSKIDEDLKGQLQELRKELARSRELVELESEKVQARLGRMATDIANQFTVELETIEGVGEQVKARLGELHLNLQQLDRHVVGLSGSLAQLAAHVAKIEEYLKSKEALADARFTEIKGSLSGIGGRLSQAHAELTAITRRLDQLTEITDRREHYDHVASRQMLGTVRQIEMVLRGQSDIHSYLRSRLDYEVMRTSRDHGCRIITARVRLSGPGADLVWPLLASFCETVMLKTLLPESPGFTGSGSYLLWQPSDGQQLEEVLSAKLAACPDSPASPSADLEALRSLLLALHADGPGTIQLGPMIINRTPRALLGCVMTAAEAVQISNADTLISPDACEACLRGLAQDRVIELTSWADTFLL